MLRRNYSPWLSGIDGLARDLLEGWMMGLCGENVRMIEWCRCYVSYKSNASMMTFACLSAETR